MSKKHTLEEHHKDITKWWYQTYKSSSQEDRERIWHWAYERWTNNKMLLTKENESKTDE